MLELNSSKLYGVLTVEAFCVVSWRLSKLYRDESQAYHSTFERWSFL